jgi:hypothetical protein
VKFTTAYRAEGEIEACGGQNTDGRTGSVVWTTVNGGNSASAPKKFLKNELVSFLVWA